MAPGQEHSPQPTTFDYIPLDSRGGGYCTYGCKDLAGKSRGHGAPRDARTVISINNPCMRNCMVIGMIESFVARYGTYDVEYGMSNDNISATGTLAFSVDADASHSAGL